VRTRSIVVWFDGALAEGIALDWSFKDFRRIVYAILLYPTVGAWGHIGSHSLQNKEDCEGLSVFSFSPLSSFGPRV